MNVVDDQVATDFTRLRDRTRASRNLGPIVTGQAISLFGDYIAYFTLPLFIVSLTGSAADLGLTVVAETIPMLLFGFAAGVFLDRRPSLTRTLILADWVRALTFLSLAAAAIAGVAETWMVFGAAFLIGTMGVFFDSGLQALLPGVLEEDMLVTANSRLALARTLAMTVGPAAGGILVAAGGGFGTAFTVNAITFVVSASFLVFVRRTRPRTPIAGEGFGSSLREGLGFLMRASRFSAGERSVVL